MELSKRLQSVIRLMPKSHTVCDVGCDHGYVAITFIKQGIADKVIAMDVNAGPLDQAKRNAALYGVSDKLDFRLSDGLCKVTPGEAEAFLCAGMGKAVGDIPIFQHSAFLDDADAEGDAAKRDDLVYLEKLPLFTKDGKALD